MSQVFLKQTNNGVLVQIHIQPNAKKSEISGLHGESLKIRIHSPPVDGEANEALLKFLSQTIGTALHNITLLRGQKSRQKQVLIKEKSFTEIAAALNVN
jgi:uncharacterized protein (TIGR00251 family)